MRTAPTSKATRKEQQRAARKRKKNTENITNIAVADRAAGMTYGQYVAKMGL